MTGTHRGPSEGGVVTVFLPGAIQTHYEILEKGMRFVEHRESDDVDPLVRYIVQLELGEFLQTGGKQSMLLISTVTHILALSTTTN